MSLPSVSSHNTVFPALKNGQKVLWGYILSTVINFNSGIYIGSVRSIEDLSRIWVVFVACNVVIHHCNNILFWNAVVNENVVSVADVGLKSNYDSAL